MQAVEMQLEDVGLFWAGDNGLMSLALTLQLLGLSANLEQLAKEFAGRSSLKILDLLRLARRAGFRARLVESTWDRLKEIAFPAIAQHENGRFFVVTGLLEQPDRSAKALVRDPQAARPILITEEHLLQIWTGHLLLVARRFRPGEMARRWLQTAGLVTASSISGLAGTGGREETRDS